ncbi:hypothetical protein DL770_006600 [Monosporascus sp. CRB-9-2]|nr:hypothetical protein DL770_006600 [Monosporascus sp. CRB-9-2]
MKDLWIRLGMDPNSKDTWTQWPINLPPRNHFDLPEFAPRVWAAICELVGGEDRLRPSCRDWSDALVVNLGSATHEGKQVTHKDLKSWHVDGDAFVHYLDSPEQSVLIIPLFTDVLHNGGPTIICPERLKKVPKRLFDHPEGASPDLFPCGHVYFREEGHTGWADNAAATSKEVVEATGKVGDVYLLHPLMLHTTSRNELRHVRVIANPSAIMKEPDRLYRTDGNHSLVERKTIRAFLKPARVRIMEQMEKEAEERSALMSPSNETTDNA